MAKPAYDVRLTAAAEADLDAIHDYLAQHCSGHQATDMLAALLVKCGELENYPRLGSAPHALANLSNQQFRQIIHKPYRMIYRIMGKIVYISVIADGRRNMQALLERRLLRRSQSEIQSK